MNLALPLGLLGLLSIAALILIYIFKPKYQDKKVSSTYVWKLSLQYRKRKVPLQWLQGSLLFLVQVLILSAIALAMAQPFFVTASSGGEKIAVLDASASMLAEKDGKSIFERAKDEIGRLAEETMPEDKFTVILASNEASVAIRRSDSLSYVKQKLFETECGFAEPDLDGAMELAEGVLNENPSAEVYLFTDREVTDSGSVHVVNLSDGEWNASVLGLTVRRNNNRCVFTARIASYGAEAEMAVKLFVDGKEQLSRVAVCGKDAETEVVWDSLDIFSFEQARVLLVAEDSFPYDNEGYCFGESAEQFRVQYVSSDQSFLYSALSTTGNCDVTLVTDVSKAESEGYDLYVYYGVLPTAAPQDGSIWIFDPPKELSPVFGFEIGGKVGTAKDTPLKGEGGNSEAYRSITEGVSPSRITVSEYSRIDRFSEYEMILMCGTDPVLLARESNGQKTVICAFDLHMSNLSVLPDFPLLVYNLRTYCLKKTLEKTQYLVSENVEINAKPNADSIAVEANLLDGWTASWEFGTFPVSFTPAQPGLYTVTQKFRTGAQSVHLFYAATPHSESDFTERIDYLNVPVAMPGAAESVQRTERQDLYVYFAAAILFLICVEWGLQYHEQV